MASVQGIVGRSGLHLYGAKELMRALYALPGKVRRKVSLAAVRAGAKPIISAAATAAPSQSGKLQASMGAKTKTYKRGAQSTIAVIGSRKGFAGIYRGYNRDPRYYAHIVELGSSRHLLPYLMTVGGLIRQWWLHPGTRPKPFLGPAFAALTAVALDRIAAYLRRGIERYAKKAA